jgi:hypothetical protein
MNRSILLSLHLNSQLGSWGVFSCSLKDLTCRTLRQGWLPFSGKFGCEASAVVVGVVKLRCYVVMSPDRSLNACGGRYSERAQ